MKKREKQNFLTKIQRNFKELKGAIAENLNDDLETAYRRHIEDICSEVRTLDRSKDNLLLDLTPVNSTSVRIVPEGIDVKDFLNKDLSHAKKRLDLQIELEIVVERYQDLFGPIPNKDIVKKVLPNWVEADFDE